MKCENPEAHSRPPLIHWSRSQYFELVSAHVERLTKFIDTEQLIKIHRQLNGLSDWNRFWAWMTNEVSNISLSFDACTNRMETWWWRRRRRNVSMIEFISIRRSLSTNWLKRGFFCWCFCVTFGIWGEKRKKRKLVKRSVSTLSLAAKTILNDWPNLPIQVRTSNRLID